MSNEIISREQMSMLLKISVLIAAVGAINWYTTVVMNRNLINQLLNKKDDIKAKETTQNERIIYALIGATGVVILYGYFNDMMTMRIRRASG